MSPRHRKTIVSCSLHNFLAFPPRTVACFSFLPSPPLCSGNPRKQKPNCRPVRGCKEARATNESLVTPRFFHARSRCFSLAILAQQRLINRTSTHRASLLRSSRASALRLRGDLCPEASFFGGSTIPPRDRHSAAFSIWNTEDTVSDFWSLGREVQRRFYRRFQGTVGRLIIIFA